VNKSKILLFQPGFQGEERDYCFGFKPEIQGFERGPDIIESRDLREFQEGTFPHDGIVYF
jgi:hypothetical protein